MDFMIVGRIEGECDMFSFSEVSSSFKDMESGGKEKSFFFGVKIFSRNDYIYFGLYFLFIFNFLNFFYKKFFKFIKIENLVEKLVEKKFF